MATTSAPKHVSLAKFKLFGGLTLGIISIGLWILVFFQILYSFIDSVEWFPTVANVIVDVLAVAVPVLALWLLISGVRGLVEAQQSVDIEGLESVVGKLSHSPEPVEIDQLVAALERLNEVDLPYSVSTQRKGDDATVRVTWREEELKWRTLLTRGNQVMRWRMELKLDGSTGTYRFVEVTSWSHLAGSGATATLSGGTGGSRGRSFGAGSVTRVWAVGDVVSPDGYGSSGQTKIVPSDAKVPVFTIVRAHGWRPRRDTAFQRMWEY